MNKKKSNSKEEINIDGRMAIAIIVTFALLLGCLTTMFVGLALEANSGPRGDGVGGGGGNSVNVGVDATGGGNTPASSKPSNKTGMVLPSSTQSGTFLSTGTGEPIGDVISSEYAILVDINSNVAVASKEADVPIHPASMTKVMTLLVACENAKDPTALLTVKKEMLERREELDGSGYLVDNTGLSDGSIIDIVGKSITLEDALYLIVYKSDTVACLLVAEYIAGNEGLFVEMMNKKAESIGLTNTRFINCTGLTEKDKTYNVTTVRDMAAIMACAVKNPVAKEVLTTYELYSFDIYDGTKKLEAPLNAYAEWYVKKSRLNNNPWAGYVKILGGKTGYEDMSTSCFVTYGIHDDTGVEYVCVTVGKSPTSDSKGVNNATSTADARTIYKKYATK